jgi:hypothetical protein
MPADLVPSKSTAARMSMTTYVQKHSVRHSMSGIEGVQGEYDHFFYKNIV